MVEIVTRSPPQATKVIGDQSNLTHHLSRLLRQSFGFDVSADGGAGHGRQ